MSKRLLRPKEAQKRLGVGHTNFWQNFVGTGRLKLVRLGPRSVAVVEEELDTLIVQMMAERDATPPAPPQRAVPRSSKRKKAQRAEAAP
jgi:predicted DNA-binding transcriptional regulator AlpA